MLAKKISSNKKAQFDYFLTDALEVGLSLKGSEIKQVLTNGMNLKESYVKIVDNEIFLINANISGITYNESHDNKPLLVISKTQAYRPKKLLLHKSQIKKFKKSTDQKGFTLILRDVYTNESGLLKGTLCLAKGKKQHDKRQTIKERDIARSN